MYIEHHKSLKNYNTFGIDVKAENFVSVSSLTELKEAVSNTAYPHKFILGGGSNMLLTKDISRLVVHINLKGITPVFEDENTIHLNVNGGENWHGLVMYCVSKNYGGIENLSLIPGKVGAAPIQNIGAYGVELKDVFVSCEALSVSDFSIKKFDLKDCEFGYRNSIFKHKEKGKFIITSVTIALTKNNHRLKTTYGSIQEELELNGINNPTIKDVSDAVIAIRQSKLPNPDELGNSGSFFKNPVVSADIFKRFSTEFPAAPYYKISKNEYKIPAGWLIEQAGFKGKRFGDAGVHKKQALVLVNYGTASGEDIITLAKKIQAEVKNRFGISIEPEVNII